MSATAVAHRNARATGAPATRPRPGHTGTRARPQARPARRAKPVTGAVRVVRTAVAIGDAADSRLIVRLTRSQAWIAIVGALLIGIVALNVYSLSLGAGVSSTAGVADDLERENSLLREQIGRLRKNGEIERFAAKLGLGQPTSEQLIRVVSRKGDASRAAARLRGEAAAAPVVAAQAPVEPVAPVEGTTATAGTTETAVTATEAPAGTTEAPPAATTVGPGPADPATAPAVTAGGVTP